VNDHTEKLTISQLESLIREKRSAIDSLQSNIAIKKLELVALEALQRKISIVSPNRMWAEFIEYVDKKSPELAPYLKRAELISITPGKLSLKCDDIINELFIFKRAIIEKLLEEYFEIHFSVEIKNGTSC
jgi:hypothetical protein